MLFFERPLLKRKARPFVVATLMRFAPVFTEGNRLFGNPKRNLPARERLTIAVALCSCHRPTGAEVRKTQSHPLESP